MNIAAARIAGTAVAVAMAALLVPAEAHGGAYRVAVCDPSVGAHHADVSFERTSRHYVPDSACGVGEPGLVVRHDAERTNDGRWGGWTMHAPYGTVFSSIALGAAGRRAGGHVPQLLALPLQGTMQVFGAPDPGLGKSRFDTPARSVAARLTCRRARGCSRGRRARIRIKRVVLGVVDRVAPTVALGGAAFGGQSRRGVQPVASSATDVGSGVRRLLLQVNGEPVTAQATRCRTAGGWALRLRPCPASSRVTFRLQTGVAPFRQGQNVVRVCSADYADGAASNRTCAARTMRVDNLCPISSTGPAPRLDAWLSPPRHRHSRGTATVRGILRTAAGVPVAGARVCVATRVPIAGAREQVVTTPATGPDGRFAAELPRGPSRHVRVAYWWDGAHVAERHLNLSVRARPKLKLRPRRPIHNGRRVRFKVRLRGPAAAHRWVRVQARSGKRWIELRNGRTNRRGVYRARYRFHATTGRRKYSFRALVPSQHGYPYRAGHSRVGHVTVIG